MQILVVSSPQDCEAVVAAFASSSVTHLLVVQPGQCITKVHKTCAGSVCATNAQAVIVDTSHIATVMNEQLIPSCIDRGREGMALDQYNHEFEAGLWRFVLFRNR